jgi:hypothetical protein
MSGLDVVVPLDGLEVREAADGQPLFILLALVDHSVDMLRQGFFWPARRPIDRAAAAARICGWRRLTAEGWSSICPKSVNLAALSSASSTLSRR